MSEFGAAKTIDNAEDLHALHEQAYQEICKQGLEPRLNFLRQFMSIYDVRAKNFVPAPALQNALLLGELVKREKSQRTVDVVEYGCLTSFSSISLLDGIRNSTITFIDQSDIMLDISRLRFAEMGERVGYIKANMGEFVQPNLFDAARFGYILSGYRDDQKSRMLASAFASLKPGGILLVQEFSWRDDEKLNQLAHNINDLLITSLGLHSELYKDYMHIIQESALKQLIEQAGFVDVTLPFSCLNFVTFMARKPS
ncbi:methyltransferase domain-containing protein [bacterium]|nr:methyltransferase domain-containing protein [bacterium]